jgi:L-fucose isomerase-like protein
MIKLKVAYAPLARTTFDIPYAKEMADAAKTALSINSLELFGPDDLVTDKLGVEGTIADLTDVEIDLLVVFQATFADSSMVTALAEAVDAPIFLWAVPEPHTGGRLRLNSFCGINLAGHALTRAGSYYGYAYSTPNDPATLEKITVYAKAGRARRLLQGAQLGRVGENPDGFETSLLRPDAIKRQFGMEVVQLDLQEDVFEIVRQVGPGRTEPIKDDLTLKVSNLDEMDSEAVNRSLGTYLTLKDISAENNIQGFAVRCWPEFFTDLGCAACGAMSMLSDEMIPCSCEADVNGTITQLILQSISGQPAFGTDIVSLDDERDAIVLWHCGLAPPSMSEPHEPPRVTIHSNRKLPLLFDFTLKPGPVTVARLTESSGEYRLVIGRGKIIQGPKSYSGTSGLLQFSRPAREVLDLILAKGLEHHISLTYGDFADVLVTFAQFLHIPILQLTQ